ncbi:hypothetical protein ACFL0R_03625 [Pseudomonadota bacterium]
MPQNFFTHLLCLMALITLCASAFAQPIEVPPKAPPPEAFTACHEQQAGSVCSFKTADGSINGLCMSIRGWELHCTPPHRIAPEKTPPKPDQSGATAP